MPNAQTAQQRLRSLGCPEHAPILVRFFKTGPGEYGEGDTFAGAKVPVIRKVAKEFQDLPLPEIEALLHSGIHEERLLALVMLREVGKRDVAILETFLDTHCRAMPRTMLRYAIERFPEKKRAAYMKRGEARSK
ncbi:MAG: DNA alkylation repair protein [Thermoguttaceae bacterium]